MQEINLRSVFVSATGGTLDFVAPDGEVLMSVAVPPGIVPAKEFFSIAPDGCEVQVSMGLVVREPRNGYGLQEHCDRCDTGANPDFQPTSADRQQRELRVMLAKVQANQKRLDARQKALEKIERMPTATPADPAPVIEPITQPPEQKVATGE